MQNTNFLILSAIILLFPQCLMVCGASISKVNITTDQSALLVLKASITSFSPDNVLATNWSTSSFVCNWIGVTCGRRHQRVTALDISNMGLTGRIPSQLGNLSFLVSLNISQNNFHGNISMLNQLAHLHRLKYLNASFNNFDGPIPELFSHLPELRYLNLAYNHFTGTIPPSFSNITKMKTLILQDNSLEGSIPLEIGKLQKLTLLNFQNNQLRGSIPETIFRISSLQKLGLTNNSLSGNLPKNMCSSDTHLTTLALSLNELDGQIPSEIFKCSRLQVLSLSYNKFIGTIPRQIGNLTNLIELYLGGTKIRGEIPPEIGNLYQLEYLFLANATLSGEIPTTIFNISTLRMIGLSQNNLSGGLPENIGPRSHNLEELHLHRNSLCGIIPKSISNASRLIILGLSFNNFIGPFPNSLGNLKYLEILDAVANNITNESSTLSFLDSLTNCQKLRQISIGYNPLKGILPASIGNLSASLERIYAFHAEIRGSIPDEIGNLTNLAFLFLRNNELTGYIPRTIGRLSKLQQLLLHNNRISGLIPTELCALKRLGDLNLQKNELYGSVPSCLGNVNSLRYLHLGYNKLNSTLPIGLWNLTDLLELDVSSNLLSGSLSPEVGNLKAVMFLSFSMNQFSGEIPSTIKGMQDLRNISFAFNRFWGPIQESFGDLISLEYLDLSHNNLSGAIPMLLESLSHLAYFNVSFNRLTGEVPKGGPFANFTYESFISNEALCGAPRLRIPACSVNLSHRKKRKVRIIISTSVATLCVISASIIIFLLFRRKQKGDSHPEANALTAIAHKRISRLELERATDGFNESNLLGKGSFGSVYKATIGDVSLAVKVFKLQEDGASRSFDTECEALRNLRHRNLVKVISSCSNLDFKALILDYMPKGSLEKWLHEHNYFLDISRRVDIMIDVASALDYLHNGYSTSVVHCDLKPGNVLLDDDLVAHVGDFGIAKLLGIEKSTIQTKTLATIGYMAPEYGSVGFVSTKCDIYSYGVMLMETFTGKSPRDEMFAGEFRLKDWVAKSLPDAITEIVDAKLLILLAENITTNMACIASIMELALQCSADVPQERMNIKDILAALKKISSKLSKV